MVHLLQHSGIDCHNNSCFKMLERSEKIEGEDIQVFQIYSIAMSKTIFDITISIFFITIPDNA